MYLWPALVCFIVTLVSPRWWVPSLRRWGVIDMPNPRSSHRLPTIRGAGLAPVSGVLSGVVVAAIQTRPGVPLLLCVLLGAALTMALLGLAEDVRGLPIVVRAAVQVGVGLGTALALCGLLDRSLGWAPLLTLAIAGYVNVTNFMDGVNGMSAVHGLVAGCYFLFIGLMLDQAWISVAGIVTASAFLGFAPWNLVRGRVFLGDVGSYLLGALVVGCGGATFLVGGSLLLAIAPALPYLADTSFTLLRRAWNRERLLDAHRSHVYQRLTDRGWSHLTSATAVGAASVLCCAGSILTGLGYWPVAPAMLLIALVLVSYLSAPLWAGSPRVDKISA